MVSRPLKYGVSTILNFNFSNYVSMVFQPLKYGVTTNLIFKIILNFRRDIIPKRDYDLKILFILFIPKGLKNIEGTMLLRPFLIMKGHYNEKGTMVLRLVNTSQEREKRERVIDNSIKLFDVFFELSGILYLCRDFVTVLAKIAAIVTLMDKIKRDLILNQFNNTYG